MNLICANKGIFNEFPGGYKSSSFQKQASDKQKSIGGTFDDEIADPLLQN